MIFKPKFLIIFLIVVTFVIYAFNLQNGLFWDDDDWIINKPYVHDFSHLKEIFTRDILSGFGLNSNYYRPLLLLSFAVNYVIGGIKPLGYHLASNGFHIANGVLIFLILSWVFNSQMPRGASSKEDAPLNWTAFIAALLFLIHPLQTEAITYISGRGDPMSVFFMLLALWLFTKSYLCSSQEYRFPEVEPPSGGSTSGYSKYRVWYFAGSVLSMIAAILSRETAVLFPLLLMIFYISFLHRRNSEGFRKIGTLTKEFSLDDHRNPELIGNTENQRKSYNFLTATRVSFVKTIPFFCVSVAYAVLRLTVFNFQNTLNFYSQANDYTAHLSYRLYTFGHALVEYFKLIFAPVGLHMERDLPLKTSLFQWPVWPVFLALLGLVGWLMFLYKRERLAIRNSKSEILNPKQIPNSQISNLTPITYNPTPFRVWFFGVGWFFISLAPVSGIVPINAVMYEHWLYLPLIGLFALAGFYLTKLLNCQGSTFFKTCPVARWKRWFGIQGRTLVIVALVGYFSFFAYQSIQRNLLWGKPIEFYEDILKYNPNTVRIMNNLANLYSEKGETGKAEELYVKAIKGPNGSIFAQPHYNLGNIYRDKGETEKAIAQYREAIKADPTFPFAYQNLAVIYASRGDLVEAALMLEKVKELKPQDSRVYYNLGLVYLIQNKKILALENLKMAFKFSAGDLEVAAEIRRILEQLEK